jgi:hypothetical protein
MASILYRMIEWHAPPPESPGFMETTDLAARHG